MKELTNFELIQINGGEEISMYRKAGRAFGEFLGVTAAAAIFVADGLKDVLQTIL
ncbi:bacteriocin [Belliella sp. DSM 107340]|uniref:Bacteriocin n=1 Tax=Belliella calami TaxID=2923436 RepID=A0ABS9UQY5_9BACT|nr:bacteriocin [Belliella calami]MCH7399037.1 bacteriocin [Belliella calami]